MRKNWCKIAILLVLEQPFRTKWWSIIKNWCKIVILLVPEQPFRTKWGSIVKTWGKIAILLALRINPFARNEGRSSKTEEKLRFYLCWSKEQPFRTKWGSIVKNWCKIAILLVLETRVDAQKLRKNCDFTCAGATLSHEMRVDRQKLR